jgi:hypothetical protein
MGWSAGSPSSSSDGRAVTASPLVAIVPGDVVIRQRVEELSRAGKCTHRLSPPLERLAVREVQVADLLGGQARARFPE